MELAQASRNEAAHPNSLSWKCPFSSTMSPGEARRNERALQDYRSGLARPHDAKKHPCSQSTDKSSAAHARAQTPPKGRLT
jgi:hypothetical protein